MDWADRKQADLRRAGVTDRDLTDHLVPRAVDPTMWMRLRFFERGVNPQWLLGIRAAAGDLHMSFQYMGHPPFDSPEGREPLREMLNAIDGVQIPAARLRGRPRIPLDVLARGDGVPRLLEVLDRIVDETCAAPHSRAAAGDDEVLAATEEE